MRASLVSCVAPIALSMQSGAHKIDSTRTFVVDSVGLRKPKSKRKSIASSSLPTPMLPQHEAGKYLHNDCQSCKAVRVGAMAMEGLDWIANSEITSNKASSSGFANSACLIASANSAKFAAAMPLARRSIACSRSFSLRETWAKAGLPRRLLRRLREAPAWARNSAAIAKQTGNATTG